MLNRTELGDVQRRSTRFHELFFFLSVWGEGHFTSLYVYGAVLTLLQV
jgi:hypothetical protein